MPNQFSIRTLACILGSAAAALTLPHTATAVAPSTALLLSHAPSPKAFSAAQPQLPIRSKAP